MWSEVIVFSLTAIIAGILIYKGSPSKNSNTNTKLEESEDFSKDE